MSKSENEIQVWTQRMTDGTNKEMSEVRKEMNEKVEKMMHKMKNSKTTQSVSTKKF